MDILDISMAANKAVRNLEESGQVGRSEKGKVICQGIVAVWYEDTDAPRIVPGKTYLVTLDGEVFSCVCKEILQDNGSAVRWLGNPSLFLNEYENTGESFVYIEQYSDLICICDFATNEMKELPFVVSETETIRPIEPKFLPGVCLPVVELSTAINPHASLTVEENEALNYAATNLLPVVVRTTLTDGDATSHAVLVMNLIDAGAFKVYSPVAAGKPEWYLIGGPDESGITQWQIIIEMPDE